MRKLPEYYHFKIESKLYGKEFLPVFSSVDGKPLPEYKLKLTPAQWLRASEYLERELTPFIGYSYTFKPVYKIEGFNKIIK